MIQYHGMLMPNIRHSAQKKKHSFIDYKKHKEQSGKRDNTLNHLFFLIYVARSASLVSDIEYLQWC